MGLFLGFLSCSIDLCVFMSVPYCFDYCSFFQSINQSTNEGLIIETAWYSRKINEGEARKPGFSPSPVQIGETSWILDSEMSSKGAGVVTYLLCDIGQGTEPHWALVPYQENGK